MATHAPSRILRLLLVLGGLGLLAVALVLAQLPAKGDARIEVSPSITGVHDGQSYAWIVRTENGALLVDAGGDVAGAVLLAELARQGVKPADVHTVLLTHGHKDHWGGAHLFPLAQVYVAAEELPYLRGERQYASLLGGAFNRMVATPPIPAILRTATGGETLERDGASVQVLAMPGHTPGSLAFLVEGVLFSGDSLLGGKGTVAPPPWFVTESPGDNRRSVEMLLGVDFEQLADGHTGLTGDAAGKLAAAGMEGKR